MSAWWTLVIDDAGNGGGGVTKFYCGYVYHGREEFPSIEAARAYVRGLVEADDNRCYREIVDLTKGERLYVMQPVTREEFLART